MLIMDEPTADLDIMSRKQIWKLIKAIQHSGTTILLSSHFLGEMEQLCDRIAIIDKGDIAFVGTIDHAKRKFGAKNLEDMFERGLLNEVIPSHY